MPAATAVPRPVALSASRMRSRSMPVAERSRPSGLRPPPQPRSEFSEAASWTAWIAEIWVTELPNRMRETISSCGRPGEEVKAICGLFERPVTLIPTSTPSMSLVATRSICGLGGRRR